MKIQVTVFWVVTPYGDTRVYPKVSGLATWSENCKWCTALCH